MKKRNILFVIVLALLIIPVFNVNAKSCGSYKKSNTCNKQSACTWYSGKCYTNAKAKSKCNSACKKKYKNATALEKCQKSCGQKAATTKTSKELQTKSAEAKINAASDTNFCASTAKIWKIVGRIFQVFKILIPVILIILASVDLGHAVLEKDDGILKAFKRIIFRVISAIIIFLLPSLVTSLIGLFVGFSDSGAKDDYNYCKTCITSPGKCDTSKDASKSNSLDS